MNSVVKMMNSVVEMMNFVLEMMILNTNAQGPYERRMRFCIQNEDSSNEIEDSSLEQCDSGGDQVWTRMSSAMRYAQWVRF